MLKKNPIAGHRRITTAELPEDLITSKELAALCWERLRYRLNASKLCCLRAKGLPWVPVSKRGYRYRYEDVAQWILIEQHHRATEGSVRTPNAPTVTRLRPRKSLQRVAGEGV